MFLLGSGTDSGNQHNPGFEDPNDLITIGARVCVSAVRPLSHDPT